MSKLITLKPILRKKSKSVQNIEEKNQFLQLFHRFDTIETEQYHFRRHMYNNQSQKIHNSLQSVKGKAKIKNHINNKDVRKILKQMKKHEQTLKQKQQYIEKVLRQQKQLKRKAQEFELAQKRIKKRIQITQKRIKSLQKTQSVKNINSKINNQSNCTIQYSHVNINNQEFANEQQRQKSDSLSKNMTKLIQQQRIIDSLAIRNRKKLQVNPENVQLYKTNKYNYQKISIKRKRIPKIQQFTPNSENNVSKKKLNNINYSTSPIKRTLQAQLQSLYAKQTRESCKRAAQLVDKLSIQRKLKLKDSNEEDFIQATNKIKLLNYFYTLSQ